ncbi:putative ABC transport system permease protein [Hydrogenivirga caldilitoris]|uniref:Putative ABC transport system permease protein n=1 Tax=Hydrogenivirga caldilitoris TaxID=246264 RepID=A0A497XUA6_9AQUI|nr:iron export ABC transporter permease subunit FetB [Hydrogenivirga caldilitoris]RLJ70722.1 putative ABC transport system permease protein [Hydrogenivirga caldilitoris]
MEESAFLLSYFLIVFSMLLAWKEGLGNGKEIFLSSIRTAVQLVLLGYVLKYLLQLNSLPGLLLVILGMSFISAFIAYERVKSVTVLFTGFLSITTTTFLTLIPLLVVGILKPQAHQLIPFGGIIVGNTLNSITLAFDRFLGEVKNRRHEIEAKVALGASLRVAMKEAFIDSLRASLIPKINFMKAAGLVHIPGVAVGMLMAGADPMSAILYQIVILYALVFAGLLGSVLILYTSYRWALKLAVRSS